LARILIIEDRKLITQVYSIVLRGPGHTVVPAVTGAEGLALFRAQTPDLVIMDVKLPDMNGLDLMRTLRAERAVPVIVLTGGDYIQTALREGATGAFTKPITADQLLAAVDSALAKAA